MALLKNDGIEDSRKFNAKAVKAVFLHDDILILSYVTKRGGFDQVMFSDLDDADYFLVNTLEGYRSGQFSIKKLEQLFEILKDAIISQILTAQKGYGYCRNLSHARFIIAQAVAFIAVTKENTASYMNPVFSLQSRGDFCQGEKNWN